MSCFLLELPASAKEQKRSQQKSRPALTISGGLPLGRDWGKGEEGLPGAS